MPPLALPDPPLSDGVVTLREPRPEDRAVVVEAFQDPEIPRWTTVPSPYGPRDFDDWLVRRADMLAAGRALPLLVTDAEGRVVGGVTLHEADSSRPDIGYWVAREHRGRGYAARAVRLMSRHAQTLGFDRVDLLIRPDNLASQHVARSAGFVRTDGAATCPRDGSGRAHLRFTWPAP